MKSVDFNISRHVSLFSKKSACYVSFWNVNVKYVFFSVSQIIG